MKFVCRHAYDKTGSTSLDLDAETADEAALLYALAEYHDSPFTLLKVRVRSFDGIELDRWVAAGDIDKQT
jgi:hypothetical protein